jgi:hypothetical protein
MSTLINLYIIAISVFTLLEMLLLLPGVFLLLLGVLLLLPGVMLWVLGV